MEALPAFPLATWANDIVPTSATVAIEDPYRRWSAEPGCSTINPVAPMLLS